jgi:hypothetical protein
LSLVTADRAHVVRKPGDVAAVATIVGQLRRLLCWRARFSYGDELMLDFGERRPEERRLLAGQYRGAWVLGMRASEWTVGGPHSDIGMAEETTVVDTRVGFPCLDLNLEFDTGLVIAVTPDPDEQSLAAWELFTPDGMLLKAGPGRSWRYGSAHAIPAR